MFEFFMAALFGPSSVMVSWPVWWVVLFLVDSWPRRRSKLLRSDRPSWFGIPKEHTPSFFFFFISRVTRGGKCCGRVFFLRCLPFVIKVRFVSKCQPQANQSYQSSVHLVLPTLDVGDTPVRARCKRFIVANAIVLQHLDIDKRPVG